MRGVDLMELPVDRALNVAYSMILPSDPKERYKTLEQLSRPLSGESPRSNKVDDPDDFWATAEEDGKAFMAAMGQQSAMLGGRR